MTNAVLDRCEDLRARTQRAQTLSYTELARSRKWKDDLAHEEVLKVTGSRGASDDAWIVSQRYMDNLLELIEQAELEREDKQIQAMLAAREDYQNWMQGDELAHAAVARFLERRASMAEAIDGRG